MNQETETPRASANDEWLSELSDRYGEMLVMDGYNDCIAGVCVRYGQEPIIIYDQSKVIDQLVSEGMTEDEAEEFHEFNQIGAWVGERTPAFLVGPDRVDRAF